MNSIILLATGIINQIKYLIKIKILQNKNLQ